MIMLPVCSATSSCCHSLISLHGGLRCFSSLRKDFESRWNVEDRVVWGLENGLHLQKNSFKIQATKSLYSSSVGNTQSVVSSYSCPNELDDVKCKLSNVWTSSDLVINKAHPMGSEELKYVDNSSISAMEEGLTNFPDQMTENANNLMGTVEPETASPVELIPENSTSVSDSLNLSNNSLSNVKSSFDDFSSGVSGSFSSTINKGENAVKSSLDTITSSITSITKSASEAVDNVVSRVFSTVDQTGELVGDKFTSFSSDLKETSNRATVVAVDVLRRTIVALEDSITNGVSFVVYSYRNTKELLPPEIRDALNLSEERAIIILKPVGSAFQQVSVAIDGLERSLGLEPSDPIVPFVLFLGTSATLWIFYWVRTYGGYSGDLSPKSTLELLTGKENAVLIDIRPEARDCKFFWPFILLNKTLMLPSKRLKQSNSSTDLFRFYSVMRERDGIPDLRRGARSRYASVYLPEVSGTVRKLLSGRELDDALIAAVIRNLKIVQDRSKVIVMDADGTRSKGIARSLRKLGTKASIIQSSSCFCIRPYLVPGGFQSWMKQGLRIKELRPETTLTILNEAFLIPCSLLTLENLIFWSLVLKTFKDAEAILEDINPSPLQLLGYGVGFVAALFALLEWEKTLQLIGVVGLGQTIYRRVASYENADGFRQDVRLLLAPVRLGAEAFSWASGKFETKGNGLPTSPSSIDIQNRVLQAAAKHESQPSDIEGIQDPSSELLAPMNENVDLSEA
ncbi:hypothetical protein EZV62_001263 [Acer yangbiense]|uniref:Rhodanese domain-containing protein n=1 Tax=Acer yangbiense TaxID=1000413 RepID=A0A5C7IUZ8_9ROSI|nr:hypothetical protein EZV62_001263 [Acer yangbiense]